MSAKSKGDRAPTHPVVRQAAAPSADLIPFPLSQRRPLVAEMADRFLTIPPGRRRLSRFEGVLGSLVRDLGKLGVSEERATLELGPLREAVAEEARRLLTMDATEGDQA